MDSSATPKDISSFCNFFSSFILLNEQAEMEENTGARVKLKSLSSFFNDFSTLQQKLHKSGTNFNIWRIAGLTDREAPPTRILAWFLKGGESHGLGNAFMESIALRVPPECWKGGKGPVRIGSDYSVRLEFSFRNESYNEGNSAPAENSAMSAKMRSTTWSRPDVLVIGPDFLLVIEAKTGTREHDSQLSRYASIAGQLAPTKPWAVVYLTPDGKPSEDCPDAFPMAWRDVAAAFCKVVQDRELTPAKLACEHFCEYIEEL